MKFQYRATFLQPSEIPDPDTLETGLVELDYDHLISMIDRHITNVETGLSRDVIVVRSTKQFPLDAYLLIEGAPYIYAPTSAANNQQARGTFGFTTPRRQRRYYQAEYIARNPNYINNARVDNVEDIY
jgi:hypothetical protein